MKSINCEQLLAELPEFFTRAIGDTSLRIERVDSVEQAGRGALAFCANPKAIKQGLASGASALVVPAQAAAEVEALRGGRTILLANNVERAMAATIHRWFLATPYTDKTVTGVHASAVVHPSARLAANVRVGPNAVISEDVEIGSGCYIGANAVIEAFAKIGEGTVIHPLAYIGHHTEIGARCEVHANSTIGKEGYGYAHDEKGNHYRIPHQGKVVLEDDVHIGANVSIDRATFGETRLGRGTKTDNQIQIAHNCKVGRNGLLIAKFGMAGSSTVGNNFVAGGDTNIAGHLQICDQVQIAGASGVTKDITEPGQYGGYPLQPLQTFLKTKAAMMQLPEMRKQLSALVKKIGLGNED